MEVYIRFRISNFNFFHLVVPIVQYLSNIQEEEEMSTVDYNGTAPHSVPSCKFEIEHDTEEVGDTLLNH